MHVSTNHPLLMTEQQLAGLSNIERKKYIQKTRILKHIFDHGAQTNASLFSTTGLSAPTCLNLIQELIADNILEKLGKGNSIGGRKPDLFTLKDGIFYILSIDMERFKTRIALFDNNNNNITGIHTLDVSISTDLSCFSEIHSFSQKLIETAGIDQGKLGGVGISMPGLVDAAQGQNYTYLKSAETQAILQEELSRKFELPVYIQNDVKCATIAECRLGLAREKKDAVVVLMDWGIGLGIVMDGKLRSGKKGFSGEIGHIPFVDNGALCYCGKTGCLETVASGIALANMAKEGIKSGQYSLLNELSDQEIEKIEPHIIIAAANRGDQYAIRILSKVGTNLGKGIATLIQLFNPETIILSGKIAQAKQYITIPIIQSVNTYSMSEIRKDTTIVLSELGQDASILGTVSLVMEQIFEKQMKMAQ